jgi:G3E family GTPase
MKTTVVCGLLGSGKTTFIKNYVKDSGEKVVVLVNDFGQAGIDGEIFSAGGIDAVELPSGCICCTLKFDLMTTLQKIRDTLTPDHLMIEPSGVASPSCVLESLDALGMEPVTVIGMVDATEFVEFHESGMYGAFFEDQIINSDIVLVNKTDLVDSEMIDRTVRIVETINPRAIIFRTVNASMQNELPDIRRGQAPASDYVPHFHFDTASYKWRGTSEAMRIRKIFEKISVGKYGNIVRAKALVQTGEGAYRFDLSYKHIHDVPFEKAVSENRLVIIGEELKKEVLDADLGELRE